MDISTPTLSLNGKIALVTGAEKGLGKAIVERFLELGATVALAVKQNQTEVASQFLSNEHWKARTTIFTADLREETQITKLVDQVAARYDHIDILINNAGVRMMKPFTAVCESDWETVMSINVRAPYFLSQKVASLMLARNRPGSIVNISSQLGIVAARDYSVYCISKAALIGMTKSLALELARHRISVNAVAPGPTNTASAHLLQDEEEVFDFLKKMPIGRRIEPREIAEAVCYLATNPGGAVTGHTLVVDGGWTIW